jgi:hypothetical protein
MFSMGEIDCLSMILNSFSDWSKQNTYQGESVNTSQTDIKRKLYDIQNWGKKIYLSTYPLPTLIPVRGNPQHRSLLSRPFPCLRFNLFVISVIFANKAELLYLTNASHRENETLLSYGAEPFLRSRQLCSPSRGRRKKKHFFMKFLCIELFYPQRTAQQSSALR